MLAQQTYNLIDRFYLEFFPNATAYELWPAIFKNQLYSMLTSLLHPNFSTQLTTQIYATCKFRDANKHNTSENKKPPSVRY